MSLRDDLATVLARDPRYSIQAYLFVFEALEHTKSLKKRARRKAKTRSAPLSGSRHVSGRELCEGARSLALAHYGMLALTVLAGWGIHKTADLGAVVDNLVNSGDLERSANDSLDDFDDVYDFETVFRREFVFSFDSLP